MESLKDISIHLPSEYLSDLEKIIQTGIQKAKISQEARTILASWWDVEHELIRDELNK